MSPSSSKVRTSQQAPAACDSPQATHSWPRHPRGIEDADLAARAACDSPQATHSWPRRQRHQRPPRRTRPPLASALRPTTGCHATTSIEAAHLAARARRLRQPSGQPHRATQPPGSKSPASRPAPAACFSTPITGGQVTHGIEASNLAARARRLSQPAG